MSSNSKIEWTTDTWNCIAGCSDISPGCANCYAKGVAYKLKHNPNAKINARYKGLTVLQKNGPQWTGDVRPAPEMLGWPLHRTKPRTIFVNSLSDTFHDDVPDDYVAAIFGVMAATPIHTYQVLTKRADNMHAWFRKMQNEPLGPPRACGEALNTYATDDFEDGITERTIPGIVDKSMRLAAVSVWNRLTPWPLPNVHLGVSVENIKHGKLRIDFLRNTPAVVRFLSVEPLLEDVGDLDLTGIHWVIVGGESGHRARECNVKWIRRVVAQCREQRVPVFVKQLGSKPVGDDGHRMTIHTLKGNDMNDFPPYLQVREMPVVTRQ